MSYAPIYGLKQTQIMLFDAPGIVAHYLILLQKETREGLTLSFKPEGVSHQLGSAAAWAKPWTHRGFRPQIEIKWDFGMTSQIWEQVAGVWQPPTEILTAQALSMIMNLAFQYPCVVEPHLDNAYNFFAQPDPGKAFELKDLKGVAHSGLSLTLVGTTVAAMPDWASL